MEMSDSEDGEWELDGFDEPVNRSLGHLVDSVSYS